MVKSAKAEPWTYFFIRLLFRVRQWSTVSACDLDSHDFQFVLNVFYGSIIVENEQYIPQNGVPCIICANHSNSLTDAMYVSPFSITGHMESNSP
jgi:glycerol-3-phosphate O-acyltransferase / dihydroxyacetone phosphate acyltransferase